MHWRCLRGLRTEGQPGIQSPAARSKQGGELLQDLQTAAENLPSSECFQVNTVGRSDLLIKAIVAKFYHVQNDCGSEP